MTLDLLAPQVKIDGAELAASWMNALVDMRVELGFRVAGRCTLRFADPDYQLADGATATLGSEVEVFARDKGPLISGDITGVSVEHRVGHAPEFVVVAHDKAHRLLRATKVATYTQNSYSDVVKKIAGAHGLTASVDATTQVLEYLMQVDSDIALLDVLADRIGFDWWVEGTTLHFKKPTAGDTVKLALADDLLAFSVRASGLHADSVRVDGWDRHDQQVVTATATSAQFEPEAKLLTHYAKPGGKLGTTAELFSGGLTPTSAAEATELSSALLNQAVAAAVTARGLLLGDPRIKPGVCVEVAGTGPLAGKYHVTQVEHIFRGDGFETRFTAGERRPTSIVDTLVAGSRGASGSPLQHNGLVVGQVTNINDDDKMGRVKVRYPGLSREQESGWARVLTMGGGQLRGAVFLPEVGDEVLVGFEGGDLRQPVVLGGLYGSKSTIPLWDVKDGEVNGRRITSRRGHYVELGDGLQPDAQHVLLSLKGEKSKFRLGKDQVDLEVPSGVPVAMKSGNSSITIGEDGSITIKGTKIVIEGETSVSASSNGKIELKGTSAASLEASGQTTVKGAMLQVESSGITQIKGSMVKIN